MDNLQQLFSHELRDMYTGEQEVANALQQLSEWGTNQQLHEIFTTHKEETQRQIERLEQVFDAVGESPEAKGGQGLAGIIEEHQSFVDTEPAEQVHTTFDSDAGKKVERYEITAYEGLIKMAKALGVENEQVQLLQENLTEERRQFDRLKNFSHGQDLTLLREQQ